MWGMFRRVFSSAYRLPLAAGGGAGLCAAAVVLGSDADLKKKPYWYRESVIHLEEQLSKLSTYKPIEVRINGLNVLKSFSEPRVAGQGPRCASTSRRSEPHGDLLALGSRAHREGGSDQGRRDQAAPTS